MSQNKSPEQISSPLSPELQAQFDIYSSNLNQIVSILNGKDPFDKLNEAQIQTVNELALVYMTKDKETNQWRVMKHHSSYLSDMNPIITAVNHANNVDYFLAKQTEFNNFKRLCGLDQAQEMEFSIQQKRIKALAKKEQADEIERQSAISDAKNGLKKSIIGTASGLAIATGIGAFGYGSTVALENLYNNHQIGQANVQQVINSKKTLTVDQNLTQYERYTKDILDRKEALKK